MKINCGPTDEQRSKRLEGWHRFFALLPRRMTGTNDCRWLEVIERRGTFECNYGGGGWEWDYRASQSSGGAES